MIDPRELIAVFAVFREAATFLAPPILMFSAMLYLCCRAGSARILRNRLWRLLGGAPRYSCPRLQAEEDRLNDYERFVFSTGIRCTSRTNMNSLLQRLQFAGIGLEEAIRARKFLDVSTGTFGRHPKLLCWYKVSGLSLLLLLVLLMIAIMVLPVLREPLIEIRQTGTLAWISRDRASSWYLGWSISSQDCEASRPEKPVGPPERHDREVLCQVLAATSQRQAQGEEDHLVQRLLDQAVFSQRLLVSMLLILLPVLIIYVDRKITQARLAISLCQRVRRSSPTQGELF